MAGRRLRRRGRQAAAEADGDVREEAGRTASSRVITLGTYTHVREQRRVPAKVWTRFRSALVVSPLRVRLERLPDDSLVVVRGGASMRRQFAMTRSEPSVALASEGCLCSPL